MKILSLTLLLVSLSVFAEEKQSTEKTEGKDKSAVESIVKKKKNRRAKAQMCHDCGKPETECTCEGEEHRKEE